MAGEVSGGQKPGHRTSEFWLTVLSMLIVLAVVLFGQSDQLPAVVAAITGLTGSYSVGRGIAKRGSK